MFEYLKKRGLRFYDEAKGDFDKEYYDFCLFHTEQMLQLMPKFLIALKTDDFPRVHMLSRLFKEVAELYNQKIMDFYRENVSIITALEQAYIGARYIDFEFNQEIANETLKFGEKFLGLFEEIITDEHRNN